MEVKKEKQIENLVKDGVVIATQEILLRAGESPQKVGEVTRQSYGNWKSDREWLIAAEPQEIVAAVMAIWGDSPTLREPEEEQNE